MASNVPVSAPLYTALVDDQDWVLALHPNRLGDDVTALATMVGMLGKAQSWGVDFVAALKNAKGPLCTKTDADTISVSAGVVWIANSGQTFRLPRRNTSATVVEAGSLDTGAMAVGYYYIYAVADSAATTFTVKFSASASAPTGLTNFELIGWFYNETAGVLDITSGLVSNVKGNGRDVPNVMFIRQTADNTGAETVNAAYTVLGTTGGGKNFTGRIYSSGRPLLLLFTCAPTLNGTDTQAVFGLHIDSTLYGTTSSYAYGTQAVSLAVVVELAAGVHTVEIKHKQGGPAASTLTFTAANGAGFPSLVAKEL